MSAAGADPGAGRAPRRRPPRARDSALWIHGDDPRLFRLLEPVLERCAAAYPRNRPCFTSNLPETREWLRARYGAPGSLSHSHSHSHPYPYPYPYPRSRFVRELKPRVLVVLEPGPGPRRGLIRRLERRKASVVRLGEADLREPKRVYDRLAAGIEHRPERRALPLRRTLEAGFLATPLGRRVRRSRTRALDGTGLRERLGRPETILCLGNGPSSEDPALPVDFDALFRVNYRWLARGRLARPHMVFVGESKTLGLVRDCVFGFRTRDDEQTIVDRHVLRRRGRIEHFCVERACDWLDEGRWLARPTNGMAMLATAVLLRPRRLIVAGIDLFAHAAGSYPGAPEVPNAYAAVHRREVEVAIARDLLGRYEGRLQVVGEPLARALAR